MSDQPQEPQEVRDAADERTRRELDQQQPTWDQQDKEARR